MGQTVDQIENRIEGSREDLRDNLAELGDKVKSAIDWRKQFRSNPGAILAVAFGGGFLLAAALRRPRGDSLSAWRTSGSVQRDADVKRGSVLRAWDDIQSALVGVIASKVKDTLSGAVPGFKDQLSMRTDNGNADARTRQH